MTGCTPGFVTFVHCCLKAYAVFLHVLNVLCAHSVLQGRFRSLLIDFYTVKKYMKISGLLEQNTSTNCITCICKMSTNMSNIIFTCIVCEGIENKVF